MNSNNLEHFFLMGEVEKNKTKEWYVEQKGSGENQKDFLRIVGNALKTIVYDYYIATIEPSVNKDGSICYQKGQKVLTGITYFEWEQKAKEFAPEYGSGLANLYELFLWYAYRIAMGYWTIAYVCDNSFNDYLGCDFELSGVKELGGFCDGSRNTFKIVKVPKSRCMMLCGNDFRYNGNGFRVSTTQYSFDFKCKWEYGSGVVVLKK